jgi:hypothetical protein
MRREGRLIKEEEGRLIDITSQVKATRGPSSVSSRRRRSRTPDATQSAGATVSVSQSQLLVIHTTATYVVVATSNAVRAASPNNFFIANHFFASAGLEKLNLRYVVVDLLSVCLSCY